MSISRTAWIDDDGTGTTGTVINNAEKTLLYDQIDAALVGYLPVDPSGYLTRDLLWAPDATYDIGKSAANRPRDVFASRNLTAGGVLSVSGTGQHKFLGGGEVFINTASNPAAGQFVVVTNGSQHQPIALQNSNAANTCTFVTCLNSLGSEIGSIAQSGANSIQFLTTSDRRLKRDRGSAQDLAALRSLVVHDFTWITDGRSDRGVFAQETLVLFPLAVAVGSDGDDLSRPWMTDYSKFVPDLIVGWQDHDRRLARLETLLTERMAA